MARKIRTAKEIHEIVSARVHRIREVKLDKETIEIPTPSWAPDDSAGCNWRMGFIAQATAYKTTIDAILLQAQGEFNLPNPY